MEAFRFQGLPRFERDGDGLVGPRDGLAVHPVDLVVVGHELVRRMDVVEDHHLFLADDDQLLFFVRVEP